MRSISYQIDILTYFSEADTPLQMIYLKQVVLHNYVHN